MNAIGEIRYLITKNWFFSIVLGSLVVGIYFGFIEIFYLGHIHFTDPLRIFPIIFSILLISLVFSLPAFLLALVILPAFRKLSFAPILARYYMLLLILILIWGSSTILIQYFFATPISQKDIFLTLCMFSFSSSFFFMSDEKLLHLISNEN
jgi:hypothetical protein